MIKNKKGFTLIELIIVMAIVGILAVVSIVAISSKAGIARNARRRSDLSAIQTAYALYTSDGHGTSDVHADISNAAKLPVVRAGIDPGTYMDVSNVQDPSSTYVSNGACLTDDAGTVVQTVCTGGGDYTFMEVAELDPGTFAEYRIAATLESGLYIYVSQLGIEE